ncbi:MAG: glycosyltransferase [Rickettsia endosymbiont of Ixodes persulcatus]|nr:glycosyltransferase [Rickettsia endosymbiont of Ixodes persulcatus]
MRIVIDLQAAQSESRFHGIGRYSLSLAKALAKHSGKHEIILTLNGCFPESIEFLRNTFKDLIPYEQIKIFEIQAPVAEANTNNRININISKKIREHFLSSLSADIIHVSSLFEGWSDDAITSIGTLETNSLTTVTLYDLIPLIDKQSYLSDAKINRFYYKKLQELKRASLLLAISNSSRKEAIDFLSISPDRIINCNAGVNNQFKIVNISAIDQLAIKNKYRIKKKFIFYTGGFDHRKNLAGLIEAFSLLPKKIRNQHQLILTGKLSNPTCININYIKKRFKIKEDEIITTGYIADKELVCLYNLCSLFVYPSLHEGFGLPVLEAMACGAATICSDTTSLPEIAGNKNSLFNPKKPSNITKKILEVLTNPYYQQSLKEHGKQHAKKFTWEATAKKVLTSYESLQETTKLAKNKFKASSYSPKKLAFVSPLPPQKTGVSEYSRQLLPELGRFYKIVIICEEDFVEDTWITENFTIRDKDWFLKHAFFFDIILYNFGNSPFHYYMFKLLDNHPGIVVLHDFFLNGGLHCADILLSTEKNVFYRALYESHGFSSWIYDLNKERADTLQYYPCNLQVLKRAKGIIVHSQYAINLAKKWYNLNTGVYLQKIPLLRLNIATIDRETARKALQLSENDFLICSFGFISPYKLNKQILSGFLNSDVYKDTNANLVFVGENHIGDYGKDLINEVNKIKRVRITNFLPLELFQIYLAATDIAIQLRYKSQGETSACIISCLAHGIPTIINAYGSAAEFPSDITVKLKANFTSKELEEAINYLYNNPHVRYNLSKKSLEYINKKHHSTIVGEEYKNIIEYFIQHNPNSRENYLILDLAKNNYSELSQTDIIRTSSIIAANRQPIGLKQLFIDISMLAHCDEKTGIQRVVRSILITLLNYPPENFRIEPIYGNNKGQYFYARSFTTNLLGIKENILHDTLIETYVGDIFLGLDLCPNAAVRSKPTFERWHSKGIKLYFVLYDLIPILQSAFFPPQTKPTFLAWLQAVSEQADGILCISKSVMKELIAWLNSSSISRVNRLKIDFFYLGTDMATTQNSRKIDENLIQTMKSQMTFCLIGRIEPRKGHLQVLKAFGQLWSKGFDINLVIAGSQGWMAEEIIESILNHSEYKKKLFWLNNVSDEMLKEIYQNSVALVLASEAEGFGLPLIESAQNGLSIIARDIPVFREISGNHAFYFNGLEPFDLAQAIEKWIILHSKGEDPKVDDMKWLTWRESSQRLVDLLLKDNWSNCYTPALYQPHLFGKIL